jgi:hypothetical protein
MFVPSPAFESLNRWTAQGILTNESLASLFELKAREGHVQMRQLGAIQFYSATTTHHTRPAHIFWLRQRFHLLTVNGRRKGRSLWLCFEPVDPEAKMPHRISVYRKARRVSRKRSSTPSLARVCAGVVLLVFENANHALSDWYDIKAPSIFEVRNVGKTLANKSQGLSAYSDPTYSPIIADITSLI